MSGGAFEIEYVVVKCFGGSYLYMCVCCVYLKDSLECCVIYTLN